MEQERNPSLTPFAEFGCIAAVEEAAARAEPARARGGLFDHNHAVGAVLNQAPSMSGVVPREKPVGAGACPSDGQRQRRQARCVADRGPAHAPTIAVGTRGQEGAEAQRGHATQKRRGRAALGQKDQRREQGSRCRTGGTGADDTGQALRVVCGESQHAHEQKGRDSCAGADEYQRRHDFGRPLGRCRSAAKKTEQRVRVAQSIRSHRQPDGAQSEGGWNVSASGGHDPSERGAAAPPTSCAATTVPNAEAVPSKALVRTRMATISKKMAERPAAAAAHSNTRLTGSEWLEWSPLRGDSAGAGTAASRRRNIEATNAASAAAAAAAVSVSRTPQNGSKANVASKAPATAPAVFHA